MSSVLTQSAHVIPYAILKYLKDKKLVIKEYVELHVMFLKRKRGGVLK